MNEPQRWTAEGKKLISKTLAEYAAATPVIGRGLRCPGCNCADLRVQNTRDGLGTIKRWRVCRNCGRRVVTNERPLGQPPIRGS